MTEIRVCYQICLNNSLSKVVQSVTSTFHMTVQNFMKIVWIVFEKFEIFIERSGEKKQKKRYDCISSRKFFSDS